MTEETLRRSDELIAELTEIVETARAVPISALCLVPREDALDILDELREGLPADLTQARRILATRERLLAEAQQTADQQRQTCATEVGEQRAEVAQHAQEVEAAAQARADQLIRAGEQRQSELVAEAAVLQAAQAAAAEVAAQARRDADQIRHAAKEFDARTRAEVAEYASRTRTEAKNFAVQTRRGAEEYAAHLGSDVDSYAERTLSGLVDTLNRAVVTAEQGRNTLRHRNPQPGSAGASRAESTDEFAAVADAVAEPDSAHYDGRQGRDAGVHTPGARPRLRRERRSAGSGSDDPNAAISA